MSREDVEARVARRAELGRKDSREVREATFATTTSGLMRSMAAHMAAAAVLIEQMTLNVYELSLAVDAHTAHDGITGNVGEMR